MLLVNDSTVYANHNHLAANSTHSEPTAGSHSFPPDGRPGDFDLQNPYLSETIAHIRDRM